MDLLYLVRSTRRRGLLEMLLDRSGVARRRERHDGSDTDGSDTDGSGFQPGGLRCRVRRASTCTENGSGNRPNPEPHHNIHRCPSGNPEDVNGRTGTGTEIRGGSETAHRYTSKSSTGHHHRNQMVPGARRRRGQRKGRRMGQACS